MARPLSSDLRTRVVARVAEGETVRAVASMFGLSVPSVVKWSRRWRATGSCEASPMGGKRRDVMAPGRDDALARLAEHPSLPLRRLRAGLAARGVRVSYGALWRFAHAEGVSFKKGRPCRRDRTARHRPPPRPLAAAPAQDRPAPARVHRGNLGADKHGPAARPGAEGHPPAGPCATGALAQDDLRGGAAGGADRRALRHRWPDQWGSVPRLCRAGASFRPCVRATWWSWTISAATRAARCERPCGRQARICCSSRHTARI